MFWIVLDENVKTLSYLNDQKSYKNYFKVVNSYN